MRIELTRRGDYAVRAMLALAQVPDARPLSVPRIAEACAIPPRYLSAVMAELLHAGLVIAAPGRKGGYSLARPASSVTVLDVLRSVEGPLERATCVLRGGPCGAEGYCDVHDVFSTAQDALIEVLAGASLASLPHQTSVTPLAGEAPGDAPVCRPTKKLAGSRPLAAD